MRNQPAIPPQLQAEIQRRLAAGLPLPEGVVAVPPGQTPPKGAIRVNGPPSSMAPLGLPNKTPLNPIAGGSDGLRTLREYSECDVPQESKALNEKVQQVITLDGAHPVAENALGKAIFAGLKMAKHCETNLHVRTAVRFEDDETLKTLSEEIHTAEVEGMALQKQMQSLMEKAQRLLTDRWDYSVKNYGLDPENRFYRVNEEEKTIEELELRCDTCTAGKEMIKARLDVDEYLTTLKEGDKTE